MSCGAIAMIGAGVRIENYDAYEIDKYAIKTSQHNFPFIKHHGDVFEADFNEHEGVDYLIGGSPCFTKGHLVLTTEGYKDISDVKAGDMVLTHKNRYMPVVRTYERDAETYELYVTGLGKFVTTENHPFYTIKKRKSTYKEYTDSNSWRVFSDPTWTKVCDMDTDTFCGIHAVQTGESDLDIDDETLWLLGRYIADGHIRHSKRNGRKNSYQYQFVISVGEQKLDEFKKIITKRHYSCYKHSQSTYRCVFSSQELVNLVENYGFGTSAVSKRIPEQIMHLPTYKRERFLDGYLSGDGYYTESSDQWYASTVSKELAFALQRMITTLYKTNVGISIDKNNRLHKIDGRQIKSNYPVYIVNFKKGIRKQSVAHLQNDIVWTQFKKCEKTGNTEKVYNIEVAEDQSYTVNNCIVHNCTFWSIAQKNNRETEASGLGWELFSQYVRALNEAKPKFFIYENNKSMSAAIRESITNAFGFEPICINSALVSAQNRQRLYWVGKRNEDGTYSKVDVDQPEDRGILLKDVLDNAVALRDKSTCIPANRGGMSIQHDLYESRHTLVAESDALGKGTIRIGSLPRPNGELSDSQGFRIYDICGKAVNIKACAGGAGGKTGLYAIPVEWDENGVPTKATSCADGKDYTVYYVCNGLIEIKGKSYPIKLADGYYIIRKLTVSECMRLQTVPDWYDFSVVSNSQAYKMLGNGWTCNVITHLINATLSD